MFDDGFFGVLCKATTKSDKAMSKNYEAMCEAIKETLKDKK
jgi:hypothetical protein